MHCPQSVKLQPVQSSPVHCTLHVQAGYLLEVVGPRQESSSRRDTLLLHQQLVRRALGEGHRRVHTTRQQVVNLHTVHVLGRHHQRPLRRALAAPASACWGWERPTSGVNGETTRVESASGSGRGPFLSHHKHNAKASKRRHLDTHTHTDLRNAAACPCCARLRHAAKTVMRRVRMSSFPLIWLLRCLLPLLVPSRSSSCHGGCDDGTGKM